MFAIRRALGLKRLVWLPLLLAGCAGHREQIRSAEPSRRIALRRTGQRPVELSEEAFRAGMVAITGGVQASQWSAVPLLRIQPAAVGEAELARTRRYLEWCRQSGQGDGDCAGVLDGGVFREDARASFALHVALGYVEMRRAALATQRFDDLVDIGRWYGGVLGPSIARVAAMLATLGVAKIASLLPMSPTGLPGAAAAAANAEAAGLPLGQGGAIDEIAVAGDGTVAATVAGVVVMSGTSDPTKPATHAPVPAKATEVLARIRKHGSPHPGTKVEAFSTTTVETVAISSRRLMHRAI